MADDPPALEQHHCDAGTNLVGSVLRPDAWAGSVNAYRKIDLTTDLKLTRYPRSLAATLAAFPSVSLFPQLGSLMTRMVDKQMPPTKYTKHTNEAESV